jgi:hypothetical protein
MGWPDAREVPNWQADARRFAIDAADRFTPSRASIVARCALCRTAWTASRH